MMKLGADSSKRKALLRYAQQLYVWVVFSFHVFFTHSLFQQTKFIVSFLDLFHIQFITVVLDPCCKMSSEPPTKKSKPSDSSDWKDHKLNCAEALVKADEGKTFTEIADSPVSALQGIGPVSSKVLDALKIHTVKELASYKFYKMAKAMVSLAATEGDRPDGSAMNVDHAVDKAYESKSFKELIEAPIDALEGLSDAAGEILKELGVKTIGDLGSFKYCTWAESMVTLADYEELETADERKAARLAKQLA